MEEGEKPLDRPALSLGEGLGTAPWQRRGGPAIGGDGVVTGAVFSPCLTSTSAVPAEHDKRRGSAPRLSGYSPRQDILAHRHF